MSLAAPRPQECSRKRRPHGTGLVCGVASTDEGALVGGAARGPLPVMMDRSCDYVVREVEFPRKIGSESKLRIGKANLQLGYTALLSKP